MPSSRDRNGAADLALLRQQIDRYLSQAQTAASQGDIAASAKMILASLDCERRLAGRGPQVLQLIKPRS